MSKDSQLRLSDKELLKSLFHVLKVRGDLDAISQIAIQEFGGFRQTLSQRSEDLKRIKELTPAIIKNLKVIYSLFRELDKPCKFPVKAQLFGQLSYFFHTSPKYDGECLRLLFLDENQHILRDFIYKKGSGHNLKFYFREIVKEVLHVGISNLVVIHHKIGLACQPNPNESKRYHEFRAGFQALDIRLSDYLIICDNGIFSFNNNKLLTFES